MMKLHLILHLLSMWPLWGDESEQGAIWPLLAPGSWQVNRRLTWRRPVSSGQDDCCPPVHYCGYKILPQSPQPQISFDLNQKKVRKIITNFKLVFKISIFL